MLATGLRWSAAAVNLQHERPISWRDLSSHLSCLLKPAPEACHRGVEPLSTGCCTMCAAFAALPLRRLGAGPGSSPTSGVLGDRLPPSAQQVAVMKEPQQLCLCWVCRAQALVSCRRCELRLADYLCGARQQSLQYLACLVTACHRLHSGQYMTASRCTLLRQAGRQRLSAAAVTQVQRDS